MPQNDKHGNSQRQNKINLQQPYRSQYSLKDFTQDFTILKCREQVVSNGNVKLAQDYRNKEAKKLRTYK